MTIDTDTMLQQISDVAWLVHMGNERIGLLNKDVQDNFTFISGKNCVQFKNEREVKSHFGNVNLFEIQINKPTNVPDTLYIKGHPAQHKPAYSIDENHPNYVEGLPLYSKNPSSDVLYAAGWYCIRFEKDWKVGHCVKLATLQNYSYEGPYRNGPDAKLRAKALNKERKELEKSQRLRGDAEESQKE